jgi:hypothetical protein
MAEPNKHLRITRDGVTLDGLNILATDDGIEVEQITDGLYVARLAIYVEAVEVDPALPHTDVTTYSPPRPT